jgi:lysophospholipid acyltransferase (LPLAT)-like uncharacterized protein
MKKQSVFTEEMILKIVPAAAALLIRIWCSTCRIENRINEPCERDAFQTSGGAVYATWHQRMFYFFRDFGERHVIMLISRSKDGEYADRVARRLGFRSVRGSAKKSGSISAMHELVRRLRKGGEAAGMMADGPTGPARELKMGVVKLARATGKPIIPMMYGARSRIVLRSWDRYILPVPFTKIVIFHGSPIPVPRDAGEEECEEIRRRAQQLMNDMADACDTYWDGDPVKEPGI